MKTMTNTAVLIATTIINCFLIYVLGLFIAYSLVPFIPQLIFHPVVVSFYILAFLGLVVTNVIMIVRYFKNKQFFRVAPILSCCVFPILIIIASINESNKPDTNHYLSEGSNRIYEEFWLDQDREYILRIRRHRSIKGTDSWELDTDYTLPPGKKKW
jgi:hypothetical protein